MRRAATNCWGCGNFVCTTCGLDEERCPVCDWSEEHDESYTETDGERHSLALDGYGDIDGDPRLVYCEHVDDNPVTNEIGDDNLVPNEIGDENLAPSEIGDDILVPNEIGYDNLVPSETGYENLVPNENGDDNLAPKEIGYDKLIVQLDDDELVRDTED